MIIYSKRLFYACMLNLLMLKYSASLEGIVQYFLQNYFLI